MNNKKWIKLLMIGMIFLLTSCGVIENTTISLEPMERGQDLEVHFIDVGQGDAILIKTPAQEHILIDAGGNDDEERVMAYLEKQGIHSLKAVIGTHPHEDHIGGLDKVIDHFEVEKIYMPKVIHKTKTFEDVLDAVDRKGLKITKASVGAELSLEGVDAVFLAPVSEKYEELNNYSAVLRLQYGKRVFLFTGDAEALVEQELLKDNPWEILKADVLKIGHHGSVTSTSDDFLAAVAPQYGIILCGKDNKYGHPHRETMQKLKEQGIKVLRTDEKGTILIKSDGEKIEVVEGE